MIRSGNSASDHVSGEAWHHPAAGVVGQSFDELLSRLLRHNNPPNSSTQSKKGSTIDHLRAFGTDFRTNAAHKQILKYIQPNHQTFRDGKTSR